MQTIPPQHNTGPIRPKALSACGVINIIFAAMGMFGMMSALLQWLAPATQRGNPMIAVLMEDEGYMSFIKIATLPGIIALMVLLFSGIGLLKGREWARKGSIGWAIYSLIATPVGAWLNYTIVFPKMFAAMQKTLSIKDESILQGMKIGMIATTGFGMLLGLTYAIVLLVLMLSTKVRVFCIAASSKPTNLIAG